MGNSLPFIIVEDYHAGYTRGIVTSVCVYANLRAYNYGLGKLGRAEIDGCNNDRVGAAISSLKTQHNVMRVVDARRPHMACTNFSEG